MPRRASFKTGEEYNSYFREYRDNNRDRVREIGRNSMRKVRGETRKEYESTNCAEKAQYRSEKHAHDVIRSVERKRNVKLRSYLCTKCYKYHITCGKKNVNKWTDA